MIATAILFSNLVNAAKSPSVDFVFSTTCDGAYFYTTPQDHLPGGTSFVPGSGSNSWVTCIGYSGRGNPSGFLELKANWANEKFDILGGLSSEYWMVPQTSTAVTTIDFSADYRKTNGIRLPQLLLYQGSKVFMASIPSVSSDVNQWIPTVGSLPLSDFVQLYPANGQIGDIDVNSHPDFSSGRAPFYCMLGFRVYSAVAIGTGTEKMDYDNINIIVHTSPN